jgi:hypothetical protein
MTVRHFDWRDLSGLRRWQHEAVFMDSSLVLTRGPLVMQGALFSYLAPSSGIYTAVSDASDLGNPVFGQAMQQSESPFAHLTFITPDTGMESSALPELLEFLVTLSGGNGALRLLADVDEQTQTYQALRRAGFAIYTRQRIWQLTGRPIGPAIAAEWRWARSRDLVNIRSLYTNLVPGLVQQVEPYPNSRPRGMVLYHNGDLLAFVEIKSGSRGVWAQPFVHPDAPDLSELFVDLVQKIPYRHSRPLYICVRSYQSWLDSAVEDLGAEAGPRQAVMVKHLALAQKASWAYTIPALEGGQPEITSYIRGEEQLEVYGTTKNNR